MEALLPSNDTAALEEQWERGGSITPDQLANILTKRLRLEEIVELSSGV